MKTLVYLITLSFYTIPLLAKDHPNGDVELQSFVLSECVIDQPFDSRLIEKLNSFGTNGYKWYVTKYQHTYEIVKKILIVAVSEDTNLYEREVVTKKFAKQDFSFIAEYWEKEEHNNFESQTDRLTAALTRYLISRKPMQCKSSQIVD